MTTLPAVVLNIGFVNVLRRSFKVNTCDRKKEAGIHTSSRRVSVAWLIWSIVAVGSTLSFLLMGNEEGKIKL